LKVYLPLKSVISLLEEIFVDAIDENAGVNTGIARGDVAWFALYSMPRSEKKVADRLADKGFSVYLPLYTTVRQWSDRRKKVQMPLIPSIVFIQVALTELPSALACSGVLRVVRYLGKPARIRDYEINNLRVLLSGVNSVHLRDCDLDIDAGIPVQIVRGPFLGVVGTCIRRQGRHHLVVEIVALNRQLELTLPVSFIETKKMPPMHVSSSAKVQAT
jgi:transcriptional antiterminator NusG